MEAPLCILPIFAVVRLHTFEVLSEGTIRRLSVYGRCSPVLAGGDSFRFVYRLARARLAVAAACLLAAAGAGAEYTFATLGKQQGRDYIIGLRVQKGGKPYFTQITVRIEE